MENEERQILDIVSPVLVDCCYKRKRNMFYRISDGIAFCITIEHPGLYYLRHFIVPLYLPQERITYTYGKRLNIWWNGEKDEESFFTQVIAGIKNDILPFFNRIDGIKPLYSFIQKDYETVSSYFSCPQFRLSLLAAYTALMLHDEKALACAVSQTRKLLSNTFSYSPNVISQIQSELAVLEKKILLSKPEIDQYYQEQIIQTTHKCFPWHKLN